MDTIYKAILILIYAFFIYIGVILVIGVVSSLPSDFEFFGYLIVLALIVWGIKRKLENL